MQIAPVIKHTDLEYGEMADDDRRFFLRLYKISSNCMSLWNCAILRDLYEPVLCLIAN